jgi:hypothetical protein
MWHTAFVVGHAAAGLVALITGLVALRRARLFDLYLWSLVGTTVFLLLALGVTWGSMALPEHVLFSAFAILAGYLIWRATRARLVRPVGPNGPSATYVEHMGFNLITLFDAFVVIAVLDLGAPIWLVVGTGVLVGVAGHFALRWTKKVLVPVR